MQVKRVVNSYTNPLVRNAWRFIDIKHYANFLLKTKIGTLKIGDPTAGSNTFLIYGYDMIWLNEKMKQCY